MKGILSKSLHLSLIFFIYLPALAQVAPPKPPKPVLPKDQFNITDPKGKPFTCGLVTNKKSKQDEWILVKPAKKGKVVPLKQYLAFLKAKKKITTDKKTLAALNKQISKFAKAIRTLSDDCRAGPPAPTPTPTPIPTPLPDELSLEPFAGQIDREVVRYLVEKAGFGMSAKEEPLVGIAQSQGLAAAVDEFMKLKPEETAFLNRIQDRLDGTLGNRGSQLRGDYGTSDFREMAFDYAINSENPYREFFRHFLLGLWTVGSGVLNNNPFDNPQRDLWRQYWNLLGDISGNPDLSNALIEIGRHPMMLLWLDNDKNYKGVANENYARELMELFSLGPKRKDLATQSMLDNYVEERGGSRIDGDIYRIATTFTGWRVTELTDGQGVENWRSVFSTADHDTTVQTIFEGTDWAFSASTDDQVVRGILEKHPGAPIFIAHELIRWYVTANPPDILVRELAKVIKDNNFNLHQPMRILLNSKAFHHPNYKNTVPKNSFKIAVEFTRILELARGGYVHQNNETLEVGVNIPAREDRVTSNMGYSTTDPPTVFFYPDKTWTSPSTIIETGDYYQSIIEDTSSQGRHPKWGLVANYFDGTSTYDMYTIPSEVLPTGTVYSPDIVRHIAGKMGVTLNQSQFNQFQQFLDNTYNAGVISPDLYDNRIYWDRRYRGLQLYALMAMLPDFIFS